jgi:hypothetical protein
MLTSLDKFDRAAVVCWCARPAEISVALPPKRDSTYFETGRTEPPLATGSLGDIDGPFIEPRGPGRHSLTDHVTCAREPGERTGSRRIGGSAAQASCLGTT